MGLLTEAFLANLLFPISSPATFFAMKQFGVGDMGMAVIISTLGGTLAHVLNYTLGRSALLLEAKSKAPINPEAYAHARHLAARYFWPVLLASWLGLGGLVVFLAGLLRFPPARALLLVALGQAGYFIYFAYFT